MHGSAPIQLNLQSILRYHSLPNKTCFFQILHFHPKKIEKYTKPVLMLNIPHILQPSVLVPVFLLVQM